MMVIFLGSWAALKIPKLLVEIEFLGGALFTINQEKGIFIIEILSVGRNRFHVFSHHRYFWWPGDLSIWIAKN